MLYKSNLSLASNNFVEKGRIHSPPRRVYELPNAAVTSDHRLDGLKQQTPVLFWTWKSES